MDKFNDRKLKAYLLDAANIPDLRISNVDVLRCNSFFETDAGQAEILIAKLTREKFQNRRIQMEYAGKGKNREKGNKSFVKPGNSFFARKRNKEKSQGRRESKYRH
jgi:hypothetical protein